MNLTDQTTSLELSEKLDKLGVKQESLFSWVADEFHFQQVVLTKDVDKYIDRGVSVYSAYTAAELMNMLPGRNKYWDIEGKWSNDWWLKIEQSWCGRNEEGRMQCCWHVNYFSDMDEHRLIDGLHFGKNIAEELGKVYVYLIENNLIEI